VRYAEGTVTTRRQTLRRPQSPRPPHSGPATFLPSTSPVLGSRISSQLTASKASPDEVETAKRTPSELEAVERKSIGVNKGLVGRRRGKGGKSSTNRSESHRGRSIERTMSERDKDRQGREENRRTTFALTTSPGRKQLQICSYREKCQISSSSETRRRNYAP
jgi:hypothetical protein